MKPLIRHHNQRSGTRQELDVDLRRPPSGTVRL
jgi:hypothetical protein